MITKQQARELAAVNCLLDTLGYENPHLEPGNPPEPDVVAVVDGRPIGIEVTEFHADEGTFNNGRMLRAEEKHKARDSKSKPYTMAVPIDPFPGLTCRIGEKIRRAEGYDQKRCDELWLLITSQSREFGGTTSTYIVPASVNMKKLNRLFHDRLKYSRFRAAYLHLMFENVVYRWSASAGWKMAESQRSNSLSDCGPSFKDILKNSDWLRNPADKARQEAQEFIDELEVLRKTDTMS